MKALKGCDLFLPLLTPGFVDSLYCQQETGFAYCKGVDILPVMISKAPMGMIADLQAVKFNKNDFENSCWKIVKHVAKKENLSKTVLDALIAWFGESDSYDTAAKRAKIILNEFDFTERQVKRIRSHIKRNSQINQTKNAREVIFELFDKYSDLFDDEFIQWYDSKAASRMWMR